MYGDEFDMDNHFRSSLYNSPKEAKIITAKFIPQYQAKTPKEQGRLEEKFLEFANHATLNARVDYKVYVSEDKNKNIYIVFEKPGHYIMDVGITMNSIGKDGKVASISVTPTLKPGLRSFVHGLEARINETKYIVPELED